MHTLLLIDPQNDFYDHPPGTGRMPALPVTGACLDMHRVAAFLKDTMIARIGAIVVTLDSHAAYGIERPGFWEKADGTPIDAFTQITAQQLKDGDVRTVDPELRLMARSVLDELEEQGKYTLMVWPRHCVIGTWGHTIYDQVAEAIATWEMSQKRIASRILKGTNPYTEHYSAVRAEVPLDMYPETQANVAFLEKLEPSGHAGEGDRIFVAGEASSHCVGATVRDIVKLRPHLARRMTLLSDAMSCGLRIRSGSQ